MNKSSPIPLAYSNWDNEELEELQKVINSGFFTMGPKVKEFENKFAQYHKSKFCVMVNSCPCAELSVKPLYKSSSK